MSMEKNAAMRIVPMAQEHLPVLASLEKQCFTTPWSMEGLKMELTRRDARFFVVYLGDEIAGYIGAHNVLGEVSVTDIAVFPALRRRGAAMALLRHLCEVSRTEQADFVMLEVRRSNFNARALYEKCGFTALGFRKNFYENPREEAAVYIKYLNGEQYEDSCN